MSIEFVDDLPGAPVYRNGHGKYVEFADALRGNPGKWAKFPAQGAQQSNGARAHQIKIGRLAGFPRGEFEAAVRRGVLYVRFTGGAA